MRLPIMRYQPPESSLEPDLTIWMKPEGRVVKLAKTAPSATVSVPPDHQMGGEEVVMETPLEGMSIPGSGAPERTVKTGSRLGLTSTGSCLEDFLKDFETTVGYEEPVKLRGEHDDDSLGSEPDIDLGEPHAGWTDELDLSNDVGYQEELLQATTGLLTAQGMIPQDPVSQTDPVREVPGVVLYPRWTL